MSSMMSSKMSSRLPKVNKPLNLDLSNRMKIDEGTFNTINYVPQLESLVPVRKPFKIKPYIPETTLNNMKGQTGSLETLETSDYNAEMAALENESSKKVIQNQKGKNAETDGEEAYSPQLKRSKLMNMEMRQKNAMKLNQKQKTMIRNVKAQVRNKSKFQNFQILDVLTNTAKQAVSHTLKDNSIVNAVTSLNLKKQISEDDDSLEEDMEQEDSELQTCSSFTSDETHEREF